MHLLLTAREAGDLQSNLSNAQVVSLLAAVGSIYTAVFQNLKSATISLVGVAGPDAMTLRHELSLNGYKLDQDGSNLIVSWQ